MRIEFLTEYTVKATPPVTYALGQALDCSRSSGQHFINKGVAREIEAVVVEKKPEPEPQATPEEPSSASPPDPVLPQTTAKPRRGRPPKR